LSLPTKANSRGAYNIHQKPFGDSGAARGNIYITAEEFGKNVEFAAVNELYRSVGLRRKTRVWPTGKQRRPIGRDVYRGPWVRISAIWKSLRLAPAPTFE